MQIERTAAFTKTTIFFVSSPHISLSPLSDIHSISHMVQVRHIGRHKKRTKLKQAEIKKYKERERAKDIGGGGGEERERDIEDKRKRENRSTLSSIFPLKYP